MDTGIINSVTQEFIDSFASAIPQIESLGKSTFYYLAAIQIGITGLVMAIRGDLQKGIADFIKILFLMGVCYGLILDGHNLFLPILNGFIYAGSSISGMNSISPSGVAIQGINIGFLMFDNFSGLGWVTHPFMVLLTAFFFIFISILYALITAELVITIIKSYCLLALSGFFAAFGANESVRQVTVNYLKAFLGCCLQLFTLYLLVGIGVKLGDKWSSIIKQAAEAHELKAFVVIAVAVLVFYKIIKTIPPFIAGFSGIQGFRSHGDEAIAAAAMVASNGAGLALQASQMAMGAAKGVGHAGKAASQGYQAYKAGTGSGLPSMGSIAKSAGHLASSVGSAVKNTVMKDNQHMSFGKKVNAHMDSKLAKMNQSAPSQDFKPNGIEQ